MGATSPREQYLLIGIDGGATEVKTHHVVVEGSADDRRFRLGDASAARKYERVEAFEPVPVAEQLEQREAPRLTPGEREQGRRWVTATCHSPSLNRSGIKTAAQVRPEFTIA